MKNLKNIILTSLTAVLVAVMTVAGTLAWLQDDDSDVNVMTLGEVKIAQHEYQRVVENGAYKTDTIDGQTSYVLEGFKQNKPILPIVGDPSSPNGYPYAGYDATTVRMSQVDSYGGMQVFAGKNAVDKFVTVENTGKSDAYVRTLVAIEVGTANPNLLGTSYHGTWAPNPIGTIVIDGTNYSLTEYIYAGAQGVRHENGILPAGDTSYPNLSQVYIGSEATNEDMVAIDGNGNGTLDILVVSQAVQADGFADAITALDEAFGDITETNHPWVDGVVVPTYVNSSINSASTGYGYYALAGETTYFDDVDIVTNGGGINIRGNAIFNSGNVTTNSLSTSGRHLFYVAYDGGEWQGNLTINGGEFKFSPTNLTRKGYYICAEGNGATVVVNGGTFHKPSTRSDYKAGIGELNGGKVTIYGGKFAFDPSKWVADGYEAIETDGWWTVTAK